MPKISTKKYRELLSETAMDTRILSSLGRYLNEYPERAQVLKFIRDQKNPTVSEVEKAVKMPGTTYAIFLGIEYGIIKPDNSYRKLESPTVSVTIPSKDVTSQNTAPSKIVTLPEPKIQLTPIDMLFDGTRLSISEPFLDEVEGVEYSFELRKQSTEQTHLLTYII